MAVQRMIMQILCLCVLTHCASGSRSNAWQDIDYSKVYKARSGDNDAGYSAPSVINCVDDDLYNCK